MQPLELLFLDAHFAAINKPSGLLVHATELDKYETLHAEGLLSEQLGQKVFPAHRLDKPTSGVLIMALHAEAARRLTEIFTERLAKKTYWAVVRGFAPENMRIDYPLHKFDKEGKKQDGTLQEAITDISLLRTTELPHALGKHPTSRYSLIEAVPHTGRQRQIRRHLKHIFHPIIGDTAHGDGKHNQLFRDVYQSNRLLLHARALELPHPMLGTPMRIEAPLDAAFQTLLHQIGLSHTALDILQS